LYNFNWGPANWTGGCSRRQFVHPSQKGWPQLRTRFMGFIKQTLHKSATAFASGLPRSLRGGHLTGRREAFTSGSPRSIRGGSPTGRRGA
jgi:hypothetical protein